MDELINVKRRRLPPLNALRAFEAAARHESFALAARELGVTPAAISRHVKMLEATTGHALFERHPQSLSLTSYGREWLPALSEAFNILEMSTARLQRKPAQSLLSISVHMAFATGWLLPRLAHFRNEFPHINLTLNTHTVAPELGPSGPFDGVIISGTGEWEGLEPHFLFSRRMVAVASPLYLAERRRPLAPEALLDETLIVAENSAGDWVNWFAHLGMRNISINRHLTFPTGFLPVQAAINGLGIALADRTLIERDLDGGQLVVVFDAPEYISNIAWYFLHPQTGSPPPPMQAFIHWLQRQVASGPLPPDTSRRVSVDGAARPAEAALSR
ncbi:LysR substrate-binding domain-containing protein [Acuticoccus kandeliae]|uniref:LysR substrate-binding domain-containing protein n=1 Tax=Acuticoccus kandeliae TaxID=2073160 RepID=UPI001473EFFB|nr:LysR substrate-binding domain-containing protein [Acuticoccus kandeliae]